MGLFSFIKNAGKKIFKKEDAEIKLSQEEVKINALKKAISDLGIPIESLKIELAEQVLVEGRTETNADREKIILALGNVEGIASVADKIDVLKPETESSFYEVKKGDYLSKIAKKVYGDANKYPVIFEANKPMLKDPDEIYPGQILRIPAIG